MRRGVVGQGEKAEAILAKCGVPLLELRRQWSLQQEAQLSVPARKYLLIICLSFYIELQQTLRLVSKKNWILCSTFKEILKLLTRLLNLQSWLFRRPQKSQQLF